MNPRPRLILFMLSLLLFLQNCASAFVLIQDIYFDSESSLQKNDGSKDYPFKDLQSLNDILMAIKSPTDINVYLKTRSRPYLLSNDPSTSLNNKFITNLTITSWEPQTVRKDSDCDLLPVIDGGKGSYLITGVPVNLVGLKFIQMRKSIQISSSSQVVMSDLCLDDGPSMSYKSFQINNTANFILQNTIVTLANGTHIIDFSSESALIKNIRIEDLTLNFLDNTNKISPPFRDHPYFCFLLSSPSSSAKLTFNNLNFQKKGSQQIFPLIFDISGFGDVRLKGLNFKDQTCNITRNGVFDFKDIRYLLLQDSSISNNQIYSQSGSSNEEQTSFFSLKNVTTLNLMDTQITKNFIKASLNPLFNFKFLQIDGVTRIAVNNTSIFNNSCEISTYIMDVKNPSSSRFLSLYFSNINIDSNKAADHTLSLFKFSGGVISGFEAQNITVSKNSFSSQIFEINTVGFAIARGQRLSNVEIRRYSLEFANVSILNNENLLNFGLLIFVAAGSPSLPVDYIPNCEYYSVLMDNLTLTNNTFFKGQDAELTDQLSVIQVAGAQLLIQNSRILDNNFILFDFVSFYREMSSVFFMNSLVNNTNFTGANFINTRYDSLVITKGPFFSGANSKKVQAIYRYAFVLNSNFTNMQIEEGSLFTFHNAFLLIENNHFDSIIFIKSALLNAGKFRPPGSDLSNITFFRDLQAEETSLDLFSNNFLDTYNRIIKSLQDLYQDTIYFYALNRNTMTNLKIYSKSLFNFEDYESQQSFICLMGNTFSDFEVPDIATDIIKLSGSLQAFNFLKNTINGLIGHGSILRLSSLEENKYFEFNNNTIHTNQGPSILTSSGTDLSNIIISSNRISNNTFSNSLFALDMILHNGKIAFFENFLENNALTIDDTDLNLMNSLIKVSSAASNENALFIFEKCTFNNNTYKNTRTFNQYAHNAMINLLLSNSSLILKDSVFQDTQMTNQGSDLFYIAAESVTVLNCTFNHTNNNDGQSIFNLLSHKINFFENKILNTDIPVGKGLLYISPYPFLKGTVVFQMISNHFQNLSLLRDDSASVLFVKNSEIALTVTNNLLVNTFSPSPIFSFENTIFIADSVISNSTLHQITHSQNAIFSQTFNSKGNLEISNNIIKYDKQDDNLDTFFKSQESPDLNVTISNLTWAVDSQKNFIRLSNVDSGTILIMDTVLESFTYPVKTDKEGLLINVGSTKFDATKLNLTLNNVTFKNVSFNISSKLDKSTIGLIAFAGSETNLEASSRPWTFNLNNCSFISIRDVPVVYVNMPLYFDIKIEQTRFDSLSSDYGPAFGFYAQENNQSNILITSSTFMNNRAIKAGGAIYIANATYDIRNNTFRNNTADDLGGAIVLENRLQKTDSILAENTFVDNSADVGNDIASLPTKFITTFIFSNGTSFQVNNSTFPDSLQTPIAIRNVSKVALNISLVDDDNHISLDTSTTEKRMAIVTFADQPSITTFNCTKWGCYINSLNTTLSGDFNQTKKVEIQYSSENSKFNFKKKFTLTVDPCLEGEHFNPYTKTCDYCSYGTYSLTANDTCQKCPENAVCHGGNLLIPNAGYWRSTSNKTSSDILQCRQDGILRCHTTVDTFSGDILNQCEPGYQGVKCEACAVDQGYVETGLLQCKKCKDLAQSFLLTIISILGLALIKLYSINRLYKANQSLCSTTDSEEVKKQNLESTYYVRLLSLYTQNLSLIYLFHMEAREFVGSFTQVGNPTEFTRYKLECSLQFLGVPPDQYVYGSVIFLFLSPLVQFLLVFIIARVFLKKLLQPSAKYFLGLSIIYIILSEQPGIVGFMSAFLSCSQDDPASSPYVAFHPNIQCGTPQYLFIKSFIIIPCLIIWVLLIPIYAFFSIYLKRNKLNTLLVRLPWGVLYNIYKPKYYWWGAATMLLGISLSFTTYIFQGDSRTCLALAFILLWIYQIAVRHAKPYQSDNWNRMEANTMGLLVLNLMFGYFTLNTPVKQLKIIAYVALAIINGSMLSFILYKIAKKKVLAFVDKVLQKIKPKKNRSESKKLEILESFLENDTTALKSESVDLLQEDEKDSEDQDHQGQDTSTHIVL